MRPALPAVLILILVCTGALGWQQHREAASARAALRAIEAGPFEVGFAQSMSLHHQQAIGMSKLLLDGRPSALAALATGIAEAQLVELGEMRGWLRLWRAPFVATRRGMDWMLTSGAPADATLTQYLLDCRASPTGMAGLASDAELAHLRRLDGRARDELFLRLMLAHHEGGLPMARFAAQHARVAAVRELARRVVLEQSEEITRMRRMQQALAAAPPP